MKVAFGKCDESSKLNSFADAYWDFYIGKCCHFVSSKQTSHIASYASTTMVGFFPRRGKLERYFTSMQRNSFSI